MATITSTQTGLWSATSTWVGGVVPVDNDTVVIASGHTVTFDVDTSGFANGIAGLTITGTLTVSTTTSSYLKMKAATYIGGAGTFNIGTSGTPIPFAVKFTLTGGSGWYVQGNGGLTMGVYGAEPTYKYVKLSGAEAINSTRLEVDTDLTGDIWAATDTIRINNVAQANNSESRVIAAITSTYIDITAGLTAAKNAGSYICLITRNITVTGLGVNVLQNFGSGKLTISSGSFTSDNRNVLQICTAPTISGGAFAGNAYVFVTNPNLTISNGVFAGNSQNVFDSCTNTLITGGIFSGNNYLAASIHGSTIAGGIFAGHNYCITNSAGVLISGGLFTGNTYITNFLPGLTISGGSFSSNTNVFYRSSANITGATISSNTYDIRESQFTAYNQSLTSTVENYLYTNLSRSTYSESLDHDQTAGAFKAWTKGGITTSVATPVPTGLTASYQIALENASSEGFFKRHLNVPAGKTINITLYLRKSASMTYLPKAWVHEKSVEPIVDATDVLHTFEMTDSVDTWESDTFSWENTADYDIALDVTVAGKNTTGYVYGLVEDTFSGGGISKARLLGGI